jgi:hypothetical protein
MYPDFEVSRQRWQKFMQILLTKLEPNRYKNFQNIFWAGKTVLRMEKDCIGSLYVLQHSGKTHYWSCIVRKIEIDLWGKQRKHRQNDG